MENYQETTGLNEDAAINAAFQELLDIYLESQHRKKVEIITKAFNFARQAHKGVKRHSGEPYIMHPLAVARIVCKEIGLGSTSICAALLHDVVEDTDYTVEDIRNLFGDKIADIVDGLTKIAGGVFGAHASQQAENFKKLLLTMNEDIRVILIKIADRLHNMRTLKFMQTSKQYKIAGETLYIYAPLANRLGLNKIKEELEDLSFRYEHPEQYALIKTRLAEVGGHLQDLFAEFTAPIRERLDQTGIKYEIKARIKSPYSIWCKMQNKKVTLDEVYDILAARIVFEGNGESESEITDCWRIYAIATNIYRPHPERLRDWLSHPKANGYQALQTTLMSKSGRWIELQIRSRRMDDIAEQGFAAHWKYKDGPTQEDEGELEKWLRTIKEILDDPQPDAMDFLDTIKLNLFASEIFIFTPKGEIKTMPQNCTALDFAFSLHTFLGSHCIGAKVNHKLVPLSHKLKSGDQVEILTSKSQRVQPAWINFATTAKAKAKIAGILKREQRSMQQAGEEKLAEFFKNEEIEWNDENIQKLCQLHNVKSPEELFAAIGFKTILLGEADRNEVKVEKPAPGGWKKFIPLPFIGTKGTKEKKQPKENAPKQKIDSKKVLKLTPEALQKNFIIADCCKPIPGDDALGFIDDQDRVVIHKRKCPLADKLKAGFGNRILAVEWETGKALEFPVNLYIQGIDTMGILHQIGDIVSEQLNVYIRKIFIETMDGLFEGHIQLYVHDVEDVNIVIANLQKMEEMKKVVRVEQFEDKP